MKLKKNYSLDVLARHNPLIAIEVFLRDSFISILENVYPEKLEGREISEFEKNSFQNVIRQDFMWFCPIQYWIR
jgi:hypothetical protein